MATRGGGGYARGDKAVAICERCSKKVPYKVLRYDGQYPDLQVCPDCWDPKHPQEYLENTFDPITLRDPTGDPDKEFANIVVVDPTNIFRVDPQGAALAPLGGSVGHDLEPGKPGLDEVSLPLSLSLTVNQSQYDFIVGGTESIGEIPPPQGRVMGLTKVTGSERPRQYDSEDDITTWTLGDMTKEPPPGANQINDMNGLAYANDGEGLDRWVAVGIEVGGSGSAAIWTSDNDGSTWTERTSQAGSGQEHYDVAWNGSLFVAVGDNGSIETSDDGVTWTDRTSGTTLRLNTVKWTGSKWLTVGNAGRVLSSTDGITWSNETFIGTNILSGIAINGSRIFVGSEDGRVYHSDNGGTSWTASTGDAFVGNLKGVAVGAGVVVATGNGRDVMRSTDNGVSFTLITGASLGFAVGATLAELIYEDGDPGYGFVAAGANGSGQAYLATSADGESWDLRITADVAQSEITALHGKSQT